MHERHLSGGGGGGGCILVALPLTDQQLHVERDVDELAASRVCAQVNGRLSESPIDH